MKKIKLEEIDVQSFITTSQRDIAGGELQVWTIYSVRQGEVCCETSMLETSCTGPVCLG